MFLYLIDCSQALKTEIANQLHHLLVYLILAATYVSYGRVDRFFGFFPFAGDLADAKVINVFISILIRASLFQNHWKRDEFSLVRVVWHGHACFELQGKSVTIVIDPFKGIGIPEPKAAADIVLCSHNHQDHNNIKPVLTKQGETLESFVGSKKVKGVSVKGVASFHDDATGSKRGTNSIYSFNLDGVQFCHLGDLGHGLSSAAVEEIGKVDVLFVPVGGYFTIGPETATGVCEQLKPKMVIPMHYRMPELPSMFDLLKTVDDFLEGKSNMERIKGPVLSVEEGKLPKEQRILVLSLK